MTINYYLDKKSNKVDKTIFAYIRGIGKGKTIVFHTGEKINPKYWDNSKQIVRKSYTGSPELNERLNTIKKDIQKIHRDLLNDNSYSTIEDFKNRLLSHFKRDEPKLMDFFDVYDLYLETRKSNLAVNSMKKFITLKNHLKNFTQEKKVKLSFDTINLMFYDRFVSYLLNDKKLTNNTIYKMTGFFKIFMNWVTERKVNINLEYKKFRAKEYKTEIVYLTETELLRLYNMDLTKNKTLEKVRDVFIFACFTGARFSDIAKMKHEDIKNGKWYLRTAKTKDVLEIPLNDFTIEILKKYKIQTKPLPVISNQKTNEYLKDLCKLAGIDEPTKIVKYRGAERIENVYPKYDRISTHTARRTFITLWLEKGGRQETLMEITGHTNYKTLKKYIKITSKVKEVEMNKIWKQEPKLKIAKVG